MHSKKIFRLTLILLIVLVNIGCDQVSKKIVRDRVEPYQTISVIKDHFMVMRVENEGAFLSLGTSMSKTSRSIFLSILPVLAIGFGLFYAISRQNLSKGMLIGLCFIIGGGIGNIFDRIAYGSVTDFLHINYGLFKTGIFNLADVSIVIGVLIVMISMLLKKNTIKSITEN